MIQYYIKMIDRINPNIRKVQIDLITDDSNPIIDWFNELWGQITRVETNVYHNRGGEFIYYRRYMGAKEFIFYQDDKRPAFWCNYFNYWEKIPTTEYKETTIITKLLVENFLNSPIPYPEFVTFVDENDPIYKSLQLL